MKNIPYQISNIKSDEGSILIYTIVTIFIFSLVMLGLLSYATIELKLTRSTVNKEQAFHIAEAGANYYEWHLNRFNQDYWDGNASTTPGPYVHNFTDSATSQVIGKFSLDITPPTLGSTIATVKSTGYTLANPSTKSTVTVRYGIPSLAQYAFLSNSYVHVGSASVFSGPFHSNSGIQFDGSGNAAITSAKNTYACGAFDDCSGNHPGIWGTANGATQAFWDFPVPTIDYSSITKDLATIKVDAQTDGLYLPPSNANGYSLVFQSNGTFRVYKVTSLDASDPVGFDSAGVAHNTSIDYFTRVEQSSICTPYPCLMPDNGVIYSEDNTWVDGVVNGRVLVAAAELPYNANTAPSILIQKNITYANGAGTDVLGLIGQQDVLLTYTAPTNMVINAALIAQNGSFQRYNFSGSLKTSLTVNGAISSFGVPAVYYGSSGFQTRNYNYDVNLLYGPPPSFPVSGAAYDEISWDSQ